MAANIAEKYQIPAELMAFVEEGFLEVLSENEKEKTIEFHIPEKMTEFTRDHLMAYNLTWIHPDFNAEFCHFCIDEPGDLPNFYLYRSLELGGGTLFLFE